MTGLDRTKLVEELLRYTREELETGLPPERITPDSPLLEWGVLDSVRTARLLAHLRDDLGTRVPPTHMTAQHFATLRAVADLVLSLQEQTTAR
ncbi:acyl carrier protein [Amycolatopsis pigmentata]|uniref:Acyl carrier protein n=1 Tax=Amycolatopsis pigmentata TaxID=450801 RepID=A0ABW5FJE2_9PSEU